MVKMKTIGGTAVLAVRDVTVQAVKRGSFNSRIGIIHVDNDKRAHALAQERSLPEDVAEAMKAKGLVKILRTHTVVDGVDEPLKRGRPVAEVALEKRAANAVDEEAAAGIASGADTRDTTAFATDPLRNTGARAIDAAAAMGAASPGAVGSSAAIEGGVGHDQELEIEDDTGDAAGDDSPPDDSDDADGTEEQRTVSRRPRRARAGG